MLGIDAAQGLPSLGLIGSVLILGLVLGWWLARRHARQQRDDYQGQLRERYVKGLNYVLDEQPDKAIETFCALVEVDRETLETHFALGNLFRKRGEVDRAIRIHQNIIARSGLSESQHAEALLALGRDYMKAGLFDRAESLFRELVAANQHVDQAYRYLVAIYEQEKDWSKAIEAVERSPLSDRSVIAHYRCEIAARAMAGSDYENAQQLYELALEADAHCVRASLGLGHLAMARNEFKSASRQFLRVARQRRELLGETFEPLRRCYVALADLAAFRLYLNELMVQSPGPDIALAIAAERYEQHGATEAVAYLAEQVEHFPSLPLVRDLLAWSAALVDREGEIGMASKVVKAVCDQQLPYSCERCGFQARALYWQCPSCKGWSTIRPEILAS